MVNPRGQEQFYESLQFFAAMNPDALAEQSKNELRESIASNEPTIYEIERHVEVLRKGLPEGIPKDLIQRAYQTVEEILKNKHKYDLAPVAGWLREAKKSLDVIQGKKLEASYFPHVTKIVSRLIWSTPVDIANKLLGPNRKLNPEMQARLERDLRKRPDLEKLFCELCAVVEEDRAKNLKFLSEGSLGLEFVKNEKIMELYHKIENYCASLNQNPPLGGLLVDIIERAYPMNTQLHSDSFPLYLFENKVNLSEIEDREAYLRTFPGQDSKMMRFLNNGVIKPYFAKLEAVKNATASTRITSELFAPRNTPNLLQTASWVGMDYYPEGGLRKAERIIGFATENGEEKVERIPLFLEIKDEKSSKIALEFARSAFDYSRTWADLVDYIHRQMDRGRRVTIAESKEYLKNKPGLENFEETLLLLEGLENPDESFAVLIDFNWRVEYALQRALLTSGSFS